MIKVIRPIMPLVTAARCPQKGQHLISLIFLLPKPPETHFGLLVVSIIANKWKKQKNLRVTGFDRLAAAWTGISGPEYVGPQGSQLYHAIDAIVKYLAIAAILEHCVFDGTASFPGGADGIGLLTASLHCRPPSAVPASVKVQVPNV